MGPILFLVMINDLVLPTCDYWKYVDDLTASEVIAKYGNSTIQSDLNYISSWSSANYMKLNAKKCKELRVCFFRDTLVLEPLLRKSCTILTINWLQVQQSVFILYTYILKRGGMTADDLLTIYIALIRSVLEYCCPVWHTNLPSYLSEQIGRLQKRVLSFSSFLKNSF
jgi:hypothetical protein